MRVINPTNYPQLLSVDARMSPWPHLRAVRVHVKPQITRRNDLPLMCKE